MVNKVLNLKIVKSGTLSIEPQIVHPFVRVSFVDLKTGKYLQKKLFETPILLHNEKNLIINHNKNSKCD